MTDKTISQNSQRPRSGSPLRTGLLATGSALVAGALVLGGVQIAQASTVDDESGLYTADGDFANLEIDTSATDVSVRYGDVDEAQFDFDAGGAPLRFEQVRRGDTVRVSVGHRGWWVFGVFTGLDTARLDIVLPEALAPVGLDVGSSAGDMRAEGDFAAVALESSAGSVELSGSASSLEAHTSAGDVTGTALAITGDVVTESSAGTVRLGFTTLPSSIRMETSVGDMHVSLPDGAYRIVTDSSVGGVEQGLASTPGAARVYSFETSVGNITLERAATR